MPDHFISGNDGYFMLDDVEYTFGEWKLPIKGGTKVFFAFGSDFQRTLPGGKGAQITAQGPWNEGNMPLAVGVLYEVHLGWEDGLELVVNARLGDVDFGNKIGAGGEPGGTCAILLESDGEFTIEFS